MQSGTFRSAFPRRVFKSKPLCQCEQNLCSFQDFKHRLAIEKRRSERCGYKSSIIFFNVKPLLHQTSLIKPRVEDIARLICPNIRFTDVVLLYKNYTILILLTDTNSNGAQIACKRIVKLITHHFSPQCTLKYNDFHIKILSFPEQPMETERAADTIPNRRKSDHIRASDVPLQNEMIFKKVYFKNLSLCTSSFNGSAISLRMEDAFFWDQELVSTFLLKSRKLAKSVVDRIGALIALAIFLPIMILVALGVKLSSPGPILFMQRRVGYKGKYFTFIKFRSMYVQNKDDTHQDYVKKLIHGENDRINNGTRDNPCYKIKHDPRVTPFGCFMRKTSLDELPQLFNVLKGDMSLVGPRPPIPYEVSEYKHWHHRRILDVKPGITGLWQVSGRNRLSFDDMVRLDIRYAEHWSLLLDLKILLKTLKVVLIADGK